MEHGHIPMLLPLCLPMMYHCPWCGPLRQQVGLWQSCWSQAQAEAQRARRTARSHVETTFGLRKDMAYARTKLQTSQEELRATQEELRQAKAALDKMKDDARWLAKEKCERAVKKMQARIVELHGATKKSTQEHRALLEKNASLAKELDLSTTQLVLTDDRHHLETARLTRQIAIQDDELRALRKTADKNDKKAMWGSESTLHVEKYTIPFFC